MPNNVYDSDKHFIIDPITREITSKSDKMLLIQYDHNSERFTFEIPKIIEGHDMSLCNLVQIHYLNVDSKTGVSNDGVYKVDDLHIDPDNSDTIICSWLISGNATQNVGSLIFALRFACVDDNGNVEYDWRTSIYKKLTINPGINNTREIAYKYADILVQWEAAMMTEEKIIEYINKALGVIENGTY